MIMTNKDQNLGTANQVKGELTYEDKVIQEIIGLALKDIKGLMTVNGGFFSNLADKIVNTNDVTTGIDVEVGKKQVAVDLEIVAEYKIDITKLYDEIKEKIVKAVKEMTGLDVIEINVAVVEVRTKEEQKKAETSLQDRISDVADSTKNTLSNTADKVKTEQHNSDRVQ